MYVLFGTFETWLFNPKAKNGCKVGMSAATFLNWCTHTATFSFGRIRFRPTSYRLFSSRASMCTTVSGYYAHAALSTCVEIWTGLYQTLNNQDWSNGTNSVQLSLELVALKYLNRSIFHFKLLLICQTASSILEHAKLLLFYTNWYSRTPAFNKLYLFHKRNAM